ncbi:tetratricopeptide repeat protein [Legionella saoudiensis]|uniref:tetratricopeptide repeat protein n=1 Tax=Legionella saoudiensis TaxID=1750561 RepID=UPI00072FAB23|nr:tetratricopeptide repeat protein [Legionella saoudiensis]
MNAEIEGLFAQAYKLQHEGKLPAAICIYEQILTKNPQHLNTLLFLGLAYAQSGDMHNAILYLSQAHALNPEDATVLNNLANAYKKIHQLDKAVDYYLQAIELSPDYAQAHNNLATIYALQNNYPKALQHYTKAVHAEPDFSAAHFNLGLLLLQNNQLEAAKVQFNNVITLTPDHMEAHFYLGILHLENNALDEAEQAFQSVLEQDNEQIQALTNLGVVALKRERNQLAVDYFSKALALDNDNIDARNNLAATFMHHDRFENALMHYDVLLQKDPDNIEYLYNSGVAQMALGHLNEAIIFFEHILRLDKSHTASLNNLSAIYLRMGQRETSREYLRQALVINPDDRVSSYMLHAIEGNSTAETTPEYSHNLFNNYALYYDQHMQGTLNYSIPQHITRIIYRLELPENTQTLDLGCGTGLTGVVLRELSKRLTGVDIAPKMLAQAKEKHIYDELIESELIEFFNTNQNHYDLIVAADVLPYFGELDTLMHAVQQHLTPEGYFIFTTEISVKDPWFLQSSARFSHNPDYVKKLVEQNHLQLIQNEKIPARIQNQQQLEVMLYVVQRQTIPSKHSEGSSE